MLTVFFSYHVLQSIQEVVQVPEGSKREGVVNPEGPTEGGQV